MVEGVSHVTLMVKDLDRTAQLFTEVFGGKEVYSSGGQQFSIAREKFFLVGGQWIAIMEGESGVNRSYEHVAFQIKEEDYDFYENQIARLNLECKPGRPRVEGEGKSLYFYDFDNHLFELHTGTLAQRLELYRK